MKKILIMLIFAIIALMIACTEPTKAGEFLTPENTNYFYGRTQTFQYQNDLPSYSTRYFFSYSMNDGYSWTRFTDTLGWKDGITKADLKIKTTGRAKIGISVESNGVWFPNVKSIDVFFMFSDKFEFTSYPDTIFNSSEHFFTVKYDPSEAPDEMSLRYSTDNGATWRFWQTYTVPENKATMTLQLSNGIINTPTIFQLYYYTPVHVVCETPVIQYKEKEVFFKVTNRWGLREIGTNEAIEYTMSDNFKYVRMSTYFDNGLIDELDFYDGKTRIIKFQKNGDYTIDCVVDDGNYRIVQTAKFTVGDPCEVAKRVGIAYKDSLEKLEKRFVDLEKTNEKIDSSNTELTTKNDSLAVLNTELKKQNDKLVLTISKIRQDSLFLKLVYWTGQISEVKDEVLFSKTPSIHAELMENNNVYIYLPLELRENTLSELNWWCFTMTGELLDAGYHRNTPQDLIVRKEVTHGMYIFYTYQNGKYLCYKFII